MTLLAHSTADRRPSLPKAVRPHASNLIEQLDGIKTPADLERMRPFMARSMRLLHAHVAARGSLCNRWVASVTGIVKAAWCGVEKRMTDIVNAFFKKHYPADLDRGEDFRYCAMLGGMMEYLHRGKCSTIFPEMVCADGFKMSVQGHYGAYSCPRDDFAPNYAEVEVGYPSAREELLMPHIDGGPNTDPLQAVYGYVPIAVVEQIIANHGGLAHSELKLLQEAGR